MFDFSGGHGGVWSADVDSRIGAQLTARFNPQFSATVQAIAAQRWYMSGGYRWGNVTPYVTYGEVKANKSNVGRRARCHALATVPGRAATGLNAALKVQYDHTDLGGGSRGTLSNLQSDFQPGGRVNLFTVTLDFVW